MEIKEIFYSYQGEGYNFGKPVIFVRFSGCNMDCPWCDEAQSRRNNRENLKYRIEKEDVVSQIEKLIKENSCTSLIFTGGEPSLYYNDVKWLIDFLNVLHPNMWYGCNLTAPAAKIFII